MAKSTHDPPGVLDGSPSHLLHRALQWALDVYAAETGPGALTQRQYALLAAVAANEGASQTWLVRATGIDRSTLADLVARMIAKGYLARARSADDARANTVSLAALGREALEAAAPQVAAADQRILSLLGPKKRKAFVEGLRRLARAGENALLPEDAASPETSGHKKRKGGKKKGKKTKAKAAAIQDVGADAAGVQAETRVE